MLNPYEKEDLRAGLSALGILIALVVAMTPAKAIDMDTDAGVSVSTAQELPVELGFSVTLPIQKDRLYTGIMLQSRGPVEILPGTGHFSVTYADGLEVETFPAAIASQDVLEIDPENPATGQWYVPLPVTAQPVLSVTLECTVREDTQSGYPEPWLYVYTESHDGDGPKDLRIAESVNLAAAKEYAYQKLNKEQASARKLSVAGIALSVIGILMSAVSLLLHYAASGRGCRDGSRARQTGRASDLNEPR